MPDDNKLNERKALMLSIALSVPLIIIRHLLDDALAHAKLLANGVKKEEEWLYRALASRVWAGIELVEARKVRFDRESSRFYVKSSRPQSGPKPVPAEYVVGEGSCDCPDHRYGKAGNWKAAPEGRCKHLAAVQYLLLLGRCLETMAQLGEQVTVQPPDPDLTLDTSYSQLPPEGHHALYH